ncbi:MAG: hypothetical protein KBD60_10070 [Sterolibacterium sp.]|jgi:acyl dehydratase|nr:hypothetical protein [Sterolibacterium sp.]
MPANEIRQIVTLPAPLKLYGAALLTARKKAPVQACLPALTLVRPSIRLEAAHIARYAELCGFKAEQGVPLTYPHMLAFPLHMLLMADSSFPYSMMGLVHLANTVRQHARLKADSVVRVEVRCGNPQTHEKGQAFSLLTQVLQGNQLLWESESTYLRTGIKNPGNPDNSANNEYQSRLNEVSAVQPCATWQVDSGIGRRYGKLSGDLNPIHLHRLGAMALGFPRAIAHGMWVKARALGALMPNRPLETAEACVEFKTPLFLPAQATLWADAYVANTGQSFELKDGRGEKPHLRGVWHE